MIESNFRVTYECIPCAINSLITLFRKGLIPPQKQDQSMRELLQSLGHLNYNESPPAVGREMHRAIRKLISNPDPYKDLKEEYNSLMLSYYPDLKQKVTKADNPFQIALRLAIAGNIIDFGPNHSFDLEHTINRAIDASLARDHSEQLQQAIQQSRTLLYLGDNAGEIVLDRLFLETIQHPRVYFAVRGGPIINDVTVEDAQQVGIDNLATIISNGDDAPGTLLQYVSPQFKEIFEKADLIIAKGQGNFEGLTGNRGNIYFLLMAKCNHVANHIGVNVGDLLVFKETQID